MSTDSKGTDILLLAMAGDRAAQGALLRQTEPWLRQQIRVQARWRRELDVNDILQVTYLEAILRFGALRSQTMEGFRAWLARVAENNLRDAIRALERDKRPDARHRVTHGAQGQSARTLIGRVRGSDATAGGQAVAAEELDRLHSAIGKLPRSYRVVVERMDLEEASVHDLARELQRTPGAIHMLRARAHDRLKELLGPEG